MTTSFELSPLLCAAATHLGHPATGDVRWAHAGPVELARLTRSDRELIHVVTGERIPTEVPEDGFPVSFFALQIAVDRLVGPLTDGQDLSIPYAEAIYTAYDERCPDGNPFSGELLDFALAFLVGRDLARLGPDQLVF